VASYGLATALPLVKIDKDALEALKKTDASPEVRVLNLGKSLLQAAIDEGDRQPYLLAMGDRAEAILEAYDDRQVGTQEALRQLEKLLVEFVRARDEREQLGFDSNTYAIFLILRQAEVPSPEGLAPLIDAAFRRAPNYGQNTAERRRLKADLYKVLLPAVGKDRMVDLADQLLRLRRK